MPEVYHSTVCLYSVTSSLCVNACPRTPNCMCAYARVCVGMSVCPLAPVYVCMCVCVCMSAACCGCARLVVTHWSVLPLRVHVCALVRSCVCVCVCASLRLHLRVHCGLAGLCATSLFAPCVCGSAVCHLYFALVYVCARVYVCMSVCPLEPVYVCECWCVYVCACVLARACVCPRCVLAVFRVLAVRCRHPLRLSPLLLTRVYVCARVCVCMSGCPLVPVYVCMCVCVCVCVCVCWRVRVYVRVFAVRPMLWIRGLMCHKFVGALCVRLCVLPPLLCTRAYARARVYVRMSACPLVPVYVCVCVCVCVLVCVSVRVC